MKKRLIALTMFCCALSGCTLEEVVDWGESCPGRDVDGVYYDGALSYIGDVSCTSANGDSCEFDGKKYNFAQYFSKSRCPQEFPVCTPDSTENGNKGYHCALKTVTETVCAEGQFECSGSCVDPSRTDSCGASVEYCGKDENNGGQKCSERENSLCKKGDDGRYHCVCGNGFLMCDGECINPDSNEYCGANDCKLDNYGGQNCTLGKASCIDGRCECSGNSVWCKDRETGESTCVDPSDKQTCNATVQDDGTCEFVACDDYQRCGYDSSLKGYRCFQDSCPEGKNFCKVDGEWDCIDESDINNCGGCGVNCEIKATTNAKGDKCVNAGNGYECSFVCADGFENCGSDVDPACKNLNTDHQNCGACNHECKSTEACTYGECVPTNCENACAAVDSESGDDICVNSDIQCGTDCDICTNIHENAHCVKGVCLIEECVAGEHPVYEGTKIIKCERNSATECGAQKMTTTQSLKNCDDNKPVHAAAMSCSDDGECLIAICETGYHLSKDLKSCVETTKNACASSDSSDETDCDKIENRDETSCTDGVCVVEKCAQGYHLTDAERKSCTKNEPGLCAPVSSEKTDNCYEIIKNSAETACVDGGCEATNCTPGFHISSDRKSCEETTNTVCAATNSNNVKSCMTEGVSDSVCDNGDCRVLSCKQDYHPSKDNTYCIKNTEKLCASTTSASTVDCTQISNSASTVCSSGVCKVTGCKSDYRVSDDGKSCVSNSSSSCTLSNGSEVNCNSTIGNSASTKCENKACKVVECKAGYHPNAAMTECIANTKNLCAGTKTSETKDCMTSIANVADTECAAGVCKVKTCKTDFHITDSNRTSCTGNSPTSCAGVSSYDAKVCTSVIANSATTECLSGVCKVKTCKTDFHITDSNKTSCTGNSTSSCAAVGSYDAKVCTSVIANSATTECLSGVCKVKTCKADFHIKDSNKTACTENSASSCAAVGSYDAKKCISAIDYSATTDCVSGVCKVKTCKSGYHIASSDKTKCVANSNTSCAGVSSYSPVDCSTKVTKYCVSGACACSTNGATVLNYDKSACIRSQCGGIVGAKTSTCATSARYCVSSTCVSGYKADGECSSSSTWGACRPLCSSKSDCAKIEGWSSGTCSSGLCWSPSCKSGYRNFHDTCQPLDSCCSSSCYNCTAEGKKCSGSANNATCQ